MSDSLSTSFIQQNVTRGTIYRFRLQAKNIYGWGSFSNITAVAAAGIPQQIAIPTTTA